jgi:hypothetical protein
MTHKQKCSIYVQHSKPKEFQIIIPTWIEQFPSFISSQLQVVNLQFASLHCSSLSIKSYTQFEGMYIVSTSCSPNLKLIVHINSMCVKTLRCGCCIMH